MNDTILARRPIRVGLIGAGNWALHGHVRVLGLLPHYELVAVYSRRREVSERAARDYGFRDVVDSAEALIGHPQVDLVVVTSTAPQHADHVRAALAAGKDVYCEWPLTTATETSQQLVALAREKGARHIVGLQRRLAPHNRYLKDLLAEGFVGKVRSVRMHVSMNYFQALRGKALAWTAPPENFSSVIVIYAGHFLDMLFTATGWPREIAALEVNQFPVVTINETGETIPTTNPDQLVLLGRLGDSGVVTIQIEGGKRNGSGVQIDITGDEGDLRITNRSAFGDVGDAYVIEGVRGDNQPLATLPVPARYDVLPESGLPSAVLELAELYAAYAHDVANGTHTAPDFEHGVRMHQFLDAVAVSTATGQRVPV